MKNVALTILVTVLTVMGMNHFMAKPADVASAATQTAYDRVKESGVLRCGYLVWPPYVQKDPNTGKISGVMYDFMESVAQKLSLKIDWSVEMGMGDIAPSLKNNRVDAFCGIAGILGARAREIDYTMPFGYVGVYVVARANDPKYDTVKTIADLNNPSFRMIYLDGEYSSIAARTLFPKAQHMALQQLSSTAELLENIATGKADFDVFDYGSFEDYNKNNPGKLKVLDIPLAGTIAAALPVSPEEPKLRQMLSAAMAEILNNGELQPILDQHHIMPSSFMVPAVPYKN